MDIKKISIWGGGLTGSFIVLLVLAYFLFPYLNPKKAAKVAKNNKQKSLSVFDPSEYNLQAVDSLKNRVTYLQKRVDSLQQSEADKQKRIDSLKQALSAMSQKQLAAKQTSNNKTASIPNIQATSKSLLNLRQETLSPIVNLLEEPQLVRLFKEGNSQQREKLLKSLKPQKAAQILKKVMG